MIAPSSANHKRRFTPTEAEALQAPMYSAEAEKAVLGSMLARPDVVIDEVNEALKRDDFFIPAHQEVYEAICSLHNLRQGIDITTLHQYLADRKLAEAVGSPGILAELAAGLATHLNVGSYIAIVKDKSALRHLQHACANISQAVVDGQDSVSGVLDMAEREIFAICGNEERTKGAVSNAEAVKERVAQIIAQATTKREVDGIPCGIKWVDDLTSGWHGGEMIVLAARPGIGKTALALHCARYAAAKQWNEPGQCFVEPGHPVGVFSLEMTTRELTNRNLSAATAIPLRNIRRGDLTEQERDKLAIIAEDFAKFPIHIDDTGHCTITQLRSKARRMKQRHGIELLIIDYLQLLKSESEQSRDNRTNEVAEISRGIKALAKELNIPIIVLAQLNRKSDEANQEPKLHNLKESGSIEQDADIVLLLHKDSEGLYSLNIAKGRNIGTDKQPIFFEGATQRFSEMKQTQPATAPAMGYHERNDE